MKRILILSPHRDDETLGCGGLIMKYANFNSIEIHVRYYNTVHPLVEQRVYDDEANKVACHGNFIPSISALRGVNKLDQIPVADFIADIEQRINMLKPSAVLLPFPSYNQDHRHIYQAARTALRPHDKNYFVPHVWMYEQPETVHTLNEKFVPNVFVSIDIKSKLELYSLYRSQQREHRSQFAIAALAVLRGSQCNQRYAEAFMSLRAYYE